ncbi:EscE/YscE/SsaE family type III secretion system needle protein co-chaperone [Bradyrhizobium genosp. P]|uniref:EscE/YscE/SsaE family type III secretion system needle protein co-chaperone n=1 Tax=Bradyrhizobium genosp. P TaxID=83641 RepID=UPI003CEFBC63
MSQQFVVFELQKLLLNDADGANKSAINQELQSWQQSFKREIDRGATKSQFEALRALFDAIDAATEVVNATWLRHHREAVV